MIPENFANFSRATGRNSYFPVSKRTSAMVATNPRSVSCVSKIVFNWARIFARKACFSCSACRRCCSASVSDVRPLRLPVLPGEPVERLPGLLAPPAHGGVPRPQRPCGLPLLSLQRLGARPPAALPPSSLQRLMIIHLTKGYEFVILFSQWTLLLTPLRFTRISRFGVA